MTDSEERTQAADQIMRGLCYIFVAVVLIALIFVAANRWTVYRACENSRQDRIDNAAGWTKHRWYIEKVTGAASVREDIKSAAREAIGTYDRISKHLTERAEIDCGGLLP